jgi:hypothetical protein
MWHRPAEPNQPVSAPTMSCPRSPHLHETRSYIEEGQHRKKGEFLVKNGIAHDPRYVFE